jgi:hypothetical protein
MKMTKKQLNWRLKDLPDAVDVAELVDKKVITPEEARQLLFNEGKDNTKRVNELEEEVKFLRELCDKLAAKSNGWTTIVREYERYRPVYPTWYAGYSGVVSTVNTGALTTTSTSGMGTSHLLNGSTKLLGNLN